MAIIQKLRNSGMVVIAVIAALVIFVLGDIFMGKNKGASGREDQDVVAKIDGEKIHESELTVVAREIFERQQQDPNFKADENTEKTMYDQAWTALVRTKTFEDQVKKAGITITDEEFNEMTTGDYPDESIKNETSFQTDGKYDAAKLKQIVDQAKNNPKLKTQVLQYFKGIKDKAAEQRYSRYISKCNFVSKAEKNFNYIVTNQGADGKLVAINYNTILDKDIKVTDDDLKAYLNVHKEEYKQNFASRDITYLLWEIIPSKADSAYWKEQAQNAVKSMEAETNPDTAGEGVVGFISRGKLPGETPKEVAEQIWPSKLLSVVGPFYKDGKYTIYQKIAEKKDTVPMVHAVHILIPSKGDLPNKTKITDSAMAQKLAADLYAKVKGGADIAALAKDYSSDGSAGAGGDLNWADPTKYVKGFKEFCLTHKKGDIGLVKTEFGWHIIKMAEDPDFTLVKYRVKTIEITAGTETVKLVDQESRKFHNMVVAGNAKSFEAARDKMGLTPRIKKGIRTDDRNIPGIDQAADVKTITYWLFDNDTKENDISDVFTSSSRHVVVLVTNVRNSGYAEVKDVKDKIEPFVRNELKAKKIEAKFNAAIKTAKTAEELAQKTGGNLVPLDAVKMGTNYVPTLFTEPKILGAIFGVKEKTFSKPISGTAVVAVIWIDKKDKLEIPKTGLEDANDFMNDPQYLSSRLTEVLKTRAEIQDYRYKFSWN